MSSPNSAADNPPPTPSLSYSSAHNGITFTSHDGKSKIKGLFARPSPRNDPLAQVVACKRLAKMPILFLAVKLRQIPTIDKILLLFFSLHSN
jgi:hypothetical protein